MGETGLRLDGRFHLLARVKTKLLTFSSHAGFTETALKIFLLLQPRQL